MPAPVRVGLLGCGNVGSAIVRLLDEHADRIAARAGADLEPAATPWLVAWRTRLRARPSYERSYPPHWRKR